MELLKLIALVMIAKQLGASDYWVATFCVLGLIQSLFEKRGE